MESCQWWEQAIICVIYSSWRNSFVNLYLFTATHVFANPISSGVKFEWNSYCALGKRASHPNQDETVRGSTPQKGCNWRGALVRDKPRSSLSGPHSSKWKCLELPEDYSNNNLVMPRLSPRGKWNVRIWRLWTRFETSGLLLATSIYPFPPSQAHSHVHTCTHMYTFKCRKKEVTMLYTCVEEIPRFGCNSEILRRNQVVLQ